MRMVDIIEKKRDGYRLTKEEITFFVNGFSKDIIPSYQISALFMAIFYKGMNKEEIIDLTSAMMHSGVCLDLSGIKGVKVDKHSTGGVGDKTSLALGPLVASCGAMVAKMSGRGLGHTGGTLDKMESVPNTNIYLTEEEFIKQVNDIGIAIIGQTSKINPADKKMYALRDVTGTVNSIPLIASSIMSKKLASGADTILLDVKFGSGAFMKTIDEARLLAKTMVEIGEGLGRDTKAILTDMDEPLGYAIGNALEVKEAINTLNGNGPKDFVDLVVGAGGIMLHQAKIVQSIDEGKEKIIESINNKRGLDKLIELFSYQGGDISYIKDPNKFIKAKNIIPVISKSTGYISHIDSLIIGNSAMMLGAGRETIDDVIDMSSGIVLNKKVGDFINEGEVLLYLHTNKENYNDIIEKVQHAFTISNNKVDVNPVIREIVSI